MKVQKGFKIITETSSTKTSLLEVTLQVRNDSYMPYWKPNSNTTDSSLNHPYSS